MGSKVITITGPSCSGKSTIARDRELAGVWQEAVSHTTRHPRDGEVHGVDYYFVSDDEFQKVDLIEQNKYLGNRYGLSETELLSKLKQGDACVVVNINGLIQIKNWCKINNIEHKKIFVTAPRTILIKRLLDRQLRHDIHMARAIALEAEMDLEHEIEWDEVVYGFN